MIILQTASEFVSDGIGDTATTAMQNLIKKALSELLEQNTTTKVGREGLGWRNF